MIIALIIGLFLGSIVLPKMKKDTSNIPPLKVIGDVGNSFSFFGLEEFKTHKIKNNDTKLKAVALKDIIQKSEQSVDSYEILIIGNDGLMAQIDNDKIEESYISYSIKNGWEAVNLNHPPSCNVKRIKEIVVVSKENDWDYGFNIFKEDENLINVTPGQMYKKAITIYPYFEGESSVEKDGKEYKTSIYTQRKIFKLEDILGNHQYENVLVMGEKGESSYFDDEGYFELKDNYINYIFSDGKKQIEKVQGALINPPIGSVKDTYYETLDSLKNDEKVMVLFLDGFGYHQYEYAIEHDYAPYISKLEKAQKVTTVFKPVTNAGFAAMITGKTSFENGIYSRKQRQPKVPTIFDAAKKLNKKTLFVEADIQILDTEIEPLLNLDNNSNGIIDDEVFECAFNKLEDDYDFAFIHFHGIDDSGHKNGDLSEKTMKTIKRTDEYVRKLCEKWTGKIIITADHGMHSKDKGGYHGIYRYEDMIIPYISIETLRLIDN